MKAPHKIMAEKYAVQTCLRTLANMGYNLPTFSFVKIDAINADLFHDVSGFCASIA